MTDKQSRKGVRRNQSLGALALASAFALSGCQLTTGDSASSVIGISAVENPSLEKRCGLDAVLVLDASSSVRNWNEEVDGNGAVDLVAGAGNAFLAAFSRTNSRVAVVSYNADPIAQLGLTDVATRSLAPGGEHNLAMGDAGGANGPIPLTTGYSEHARRGSGTNWEGGLLLAGEILAGSTRDVPRLVVHVTDGRPTRHIDANGDVTRDGGKDVHVAEAAEVADVLKAAGVHIYSVGIGRAGAGEYLEELQAVSGTDVYDQADPADSFNASNDDVILAIDFADLETVLTGLANQLCSSSLTITKLASTPEARDVYTEVADVEFTARPDASSGFDWLLPDNAAATAKTAATDAGGRAQFQFDIVNDAAWGAGNVTVTETAVPGFVLETEVNCTRINRDDSFTVRADPDTGTFAVPVGIGDTVACEVRNTPEEITIPTEPPDFHSCTLVSSEEPSDAIPAAGGSVRFRVLSYNNDGQTLHLESMHDSILGDLLDPENPRIVSGWCQTVLEPNATSSCSWEVLMDGGTPGANQVHNTEVVFRNENGETASSAYEAIYQIAE